MSTVVSSTSPQSGQLARMVAMASSIGDSPTTLEHPRSTRGEIVPMSPRVGTVDTSSVLSVASGDLQQVLRLIAAGTEPRRVAARVLDAAMSSGAATDGLVLRADAIVASKGAPTATMRRAAAAAIDSGRLSRQPDEGRR